MSAPLFASGRTVRLVIAPPGSPDGLSDHALDGALHARNAVLAETLADARHPLTPDENANTSGDGVDAILDWLDEQPAPGKSLSLSDPLLSRLAPAYLHALTQRGLEAEIEIGVEPIVDSEARAQSGFRTGPLQARLAVLRHYLDAEGLTRGEARVFAGSVSVQSAPTGLPLVDRWTKRLESALKRLCGSPDDEKALRGMDALRADYAGHSALMGDAVLAEAQALQLAFEETAGIFDARLTYLSDSLDSRAARNRTLTRQRNDARAELGTATARIEALRLDVEAWEQLASLNEAVAQTARPVRAVTRTVPEIVIEPDPKTVAELSEARRHVRLRQREVEALHAAMDQMRASTSWRVTAWLRRLSGLLSRGKAP